MKCERYFIEKTEETCLRCRQDKEFRKSMSVRKNGLLIDLASCPNRSNIFDDKYIFCSLYQQTKDLFFCAVCDHKTRIFNIACSSHGIGDALCGLYVCAGILDKYPQAILNYFSRYPQWTVMAEGIQAFDWKDTCAVQSFIEIYRSYSEELRSDKPRKEWYAETVSVKPAIPKLKPIERKPIFTSDYIAIAPFSAWRNRSWNIGAWLYLECLIREQLKMQTVILDGPGDGSRTGCFQGFRIWGHPPETVVNIVKNSRCTIANDSMIAHLGGLLDVKTIAIVAQIEARKLFSLTNVISITGDAKCVGCNFQYDRGYRNGCDHECFALNSITPFLVFNKLKEIVS